jgi:hypothetical protein
MSILIHIVHQVVLRVSSYCHNFQLIWWLDRRPLCFCFEFFFYWLLLHLCVVHLNFLVMSLLLYLLPQSLRSLWLKLFLGIGFIWRRLLSKIIIASIWFISFSSFFTHYYSYFLLFLFLDHVSFPLHCFKFCFEQRLFLCSSIQEVIEYMPWAVEALFWLPSALIGWIILPFDPIVLNSICDPSVKDILDNIDFPFFCLIFFYHDLRVESIY